MLYNDMCVRIPGESAVQFFVLIIVLRLRILLPSTCFHAIIIMWFRRI